MKFSEDIMFNYKWNVAKVATQCAQTVLSIITQIRTQNNVAICFVWCEIWPFSLQKECKVQYLKSSAQENIST
jgi:hypothetical protein